GRGASARPGAAADVAPALAAAGLTRAPTGTDARGGTAPSRTTPRVCSRTVPPPVPSGGASGVRRAVPWRLRTGGGEGHPAGRVGWWHGAEEARRPPPASRRPGVPGHASGGDRRAGGHPLHHVFTCPTAARNRWNIRA